MNILPSRKKGNIPCIAACACFQSLLNVRRVSSMASLDSCRCCVTRPGCWLHYLSDYSHCAYCQLKLSCYFRISHDHNKLPVPFQVQVVVADTPSPPCPPCGLPAPDQLYMHCCTVSMLAWHQHLCTWLLLLCCGCAVSKVV